jgi:hypothetical protein
MRNLLLQLTGRAIRTRVLTFAILLFVPVAFAVHTEQASAASFDILFECDLGCTTGVDQPVGSFSIEDSILLDLGNADSLVDVQSSRVSAFGFTWEHPASPDFGGTAPQALLDANGDPLALSWSASAAGIGINFKLFDFDTTPPGWACEGDCPVLGGASGTYSVVPVPEPSAVLVFGLGLVVVSPLLRRSR